MPVSLWEQRVPENPQSEGNYRKFKEEVEFCSTEIKTQGCCSSPALFQGNHAGGNTGRGVCGGILHPVAFLFWAGLSYMAPVPSCSARLCRGSLSRPAEHRHGRGDRVAEVTALSGRAARSHTVAVVSHVQEELCQGVSSACMRCTTSSAHPRGVTAQLSSLSPLGDCPKPTGGW